jgi:hypothetical protein
MMPELFAGVPIQRLLVVSVALSTRECTFAIISGAEILC